MWRQQTHHTILLSHLWPSLLLKLAPPLSELQEHLSLPIRYIQRRVSDFVTPTAVVVSSQQSVTSSSSKKKKPQTITRKKGKKVTTALPHPTHTYQKEKEAFVSPTHLFHSKITHTTKSQNVSEKKGKIKNNSLPHHSSQSVSRSSQVACLITQIARS